MPKWGPEIKSRVRRPPRGQLPLKERRAMAVNRIAREAGVPPHIVERALNAEGYGHASPQRIAVKILGIKRTLEKEEYLKNLEARVNRDIERHGLKRTLKDIARSVGMHASEQDVSHCLKKQGLQEKQAQEAEKIRRRKVERKNRERMDGTGKIKGKAGELPLKTIKIDRLDKVLALNDSGWLEKKADAFWAHIAKIGRDKIGIGTTAYFMCRDGYGLEEISTATGYEKKTLQGLFKAMGLNERKTSIHALQPGAWNRIARANNFLDTNHKSTKYTIKDISDHSGMTLEDALVVRHISGAVSRFFLSLGKSP
ncbi:MAG: hypothetical protein V1494_02055 [Candidatus Diapherotrites archaeon]